MNVKFEYLYRDAGNNKIWGEVIFGNSNNIDTSFLNHKIENNLIDEEFFVANKISLPSLNFEKFDKDLDHGWHEYYAICDSDEHPNDSYGRDISEFIHVLEIAGFSKL